MSNNNKKKDSGYVPLGYLGVNPVFWSHEVQQLINDKSPSWLKAENLSMVVGSKVLADFEEEVPSKDVSKLKTKTNFAACAAKLMEECKAAGPFSGEARFRSSGVWVAHDDPTQLVVNSLTLKRTDSAPIERCIAGREHIYKLGKDIGDPLATTPATDKEARLAYKEISKWNYLNPSDQILVFGWLGLSYLVGAVGWRPHVFIQAPAGSGKSSLLRLLNRYSPPTKASGGIVDGGGSTEAGIRQFLDSMALPIILDESEAKGSGFDQGWIELLKTASSGAMRLKGTSGQEGKQFEINLTALVAGINPPAPDSALQSRLAVIQLGILPVGAIAPDDASDEKEGSYFDVIARKKGAALQARMVRAWTAYLHNFKEVKEALCSCAQRFRETIGTLLAAGITLRFGRELSAKSIRRYLAKLNLLPHQDATIRNDGSDAALHLVQSIIQVDDEGEPMGKFSIGHCAKMAVSFPKKGKATPWGEALGRIGLSAEILDDGNLALACHTGRPHFELGKIFKALSPALERGYINILKQVHGSKQGNLVRRIGDGSAKIEGKALVFPIPVESAEQQELAELKEKAAQHAEEVKAGKTQKVLPALDLITTQSEEIAALKAELAKAQQSKIEAQPAPKLALALVEKKSHLAETPDIETLKMKPKKDPLDDYDSIDWGETITIQR